MVNQNCDFIILFLSVLEAFCIFQSCSTLGSRRLGLENGLFLSLSLYLPLPFSWFNFSSSLGVITLYTYQVAQVGHSNRTSYIYLKRKRKNSDFIDLVRNP